jgi:small subunit ribosomal protein S3
MGQKIDPRGFRLAVTRDWSSRWYANNQNFATILLEDLKIREFLQKKYGRRAAIGRIVIERPAKSIKITLFTARPGVIIGKKGEGIEQIKQELQKMTDVSLHLNVEEIRKPELNAQIVADSVAIQVEKRVAFRRAMKRAMQGAMKMGALGIKIKTSGRLNGVMSGIVKDVFLYIHYVLILITQLVRLLLHLESSVLRYGFTKVRKT